MTWQELADFINNKMPEEERNKVANVFDYSTDNPSGGKFFGVIGISPFDESEDCDYSIDINTEKPWN